jgi:hypothetical protein
VSALDAALRRFRAQPTSRAARHELAKQLLWLLQRWRVARGCSPDYRPLAASVRRALQIIEFRRVTAVAEAVRIVRDAAFGEGLLP